MDAGGKAEVSPPRNHNASLSPDAAEALRAELLRQKIVFESELRRQREHFEERFENAEREIKARGDECRNLQAALTAMGRKIEAMEKANILAAESPPKQQRHSSPAAVRPSTSQQTPRTNSPVVRRPSPTPVARAGSPTIQGRKPSPTPQRHAGAGTGIPAQIKAALNNSGSTLSTKSQQLDAPPAPRVPPFLLSQIIPPTGAPTTKATGSELPPAKLELQRIYGVGSLQNVQTPPVILSVGEGNRALYTAGSVCAIIGPDGAPAYYYGQTDVVTAASLHPGDAKFKPGSVVATAQGGRKPHICIWEIESMTTICTLRDFHEKSILAVSFAPSGEYLSTISGDTQHTLYVFLWQSKELLVTAKVSTEQFSSMQYHPYDARMLITLCSHNLKIWEMQFTGKGQSMKIAPRTGLLPATPGKNNRCAGFKSMAFLDNKVTLVGSLEGSLYLWRGTDLSTIIEGVHPGGVTAATDVPHTDVVLTSGYDGNIHVWRRSALLSDGGAAFTPIRTVHVKEFFESVKPYSLSALLSFSVSAATESGINLFAISNGNFVVQIVLGADAATSSGSCKVLTTSHGRCQTAPLIVTHPSTNKMYAVSQSQLQVLDIADGKLSRSVPLSTPVTVMAIHPNGTTLAMARAPKSISFYDTASLVETSTISDSFPDASLLKFSPSGQYLAVASAKESIVEVYDIPNSYKRLGRTKHSGPVQHLDWSMDSEFFQTDDVSKQHLYFRKDCTRVADSRMCADLIFTPWTCKYGWPVQGIWEDPAQPEDITSVRTTRDNRLCFVGDSKGNIKVFLYPSASKLASHRLYRGHGPNVSNILLNFDESTLITTSSDGCIFQWGVAPLEQ